MSKTIIISGLYEDYNDTKQDWECIMHSPDNFLIDRQPIIELLDEYKGKEIRITIEEI